MKINFEKLPCYMNITKQGKVMINVKNELSNSLYTQGGGVEMGALALKIYNSKDEEEYSEAECNLLLNFVKKTNSFSPIFIDSLEDLLKQKENLQE